MKARLSADEVAILTFLAQDDGDYQFNAWAINAGNPFTKARDLTSLKRRGLVDADGRGKSRQWWITDEGKAAIAAVVS